ncbi:hypothetical protein AAZX31_12G071600 [Glycine max]|uniref:Nudix hydrolase domain-containing protein n=2 Tax=Glycine subgen. Soja TaxID=1462606 RepID=A0A0R4J4I4_SOYBN|nr:nudix hydrolase 9 isoform X1 [Glycine max]XP_028192567.1 nudix hydrolase 9 isoform X1 [Glycine soja]KAH1142108.1 hypothetical protein GYH30_032998 [Glycine max]KAH1220505.1 Nudix hydrolase 9 [Glycine max]KRH25005.1 hypothetical protein GLYMA_12G075000v4 [Glycine max]RZB74792.1 Nudix hydrolase 9 isoform A [Glycine soja]|eukprot:XP_003539756.1 nudix hydrolase 9 isoform X1 [Glycine max]
MEKEASSTDDPSSFTLLVSCPSGLSPSQVSVAFSDAYDRIPHSDVILENTISEIWKQRSQKNNSLFNGKKFRYGGCVLHAKDGSDHECEPHLCLHLGLTDYRTFVGTNLSPLWERFLVPSEDDSVLCQHTSNPLGNGAVVETNDNKILVLQRSDNVGEFPGHFVFPGGHPEPQEIGITSHQYNKELTESINTKVSQEMFDSIVREVVEEIGVPASSLSIPAFIGISRRNLNVRPAAFFFIKCGLDSKEVRQFYSSAQDGYESTQLYAVPMIEIENMTSRMPGCHRGGFALYKLMVDTRKIT